MYWLLQVPFSFQILEWTCSKSFVACVASAKGEDQGGKGDKKIRGKKEEGGLGTGDWGLGRREGKGALAATLLFSSFTRSLANVKIPLAKRCGDCQARNISYRACCFAKSEAKLRWRRKICWSGLSFQLLVLLEQKRNNHSFIIQLQVVLVVCPLTSIINNRWVVQLATWQENLDKLQDIEAGKFNIVYASK